MWLLEFEKLCSQLEGPSVIQTAFLRIHLVNNGRRETSPFQLHCVLRRLEQSEHALTIDIRSV